MTLLKLIKPVIVLSSFFILTAQASAADSDVIIPYYGAEFYEDYANQVADDDLVLRLKTVLRSFHIQRPGEADVIANSCDNSGRCYQHQALTYRAARKVIMGELFLTQASDRSWQVYDAYCDSDRGEFEFGDTLKPGQIPDENVMNVEHTWPQSRFNKSIFKDIQKSDLHHLFPTDSVLNATRGNHIFGEVSSDKQILRCPESRIGYGTAGSEEVYEPPQSHKGNVARALFYFSIRYDLSIDSAEESVLRKWNQEDPVDASEISRNERIFELQHNRNPFVDFPDLVDRISEF